MKDKLFMIFLIVGVIFPLFLYSQGEKIELRRLTGNADILSAISNDADRMSAFPVRAERMSALQYFDMRKLDYIPNRSAGNFNRLLAVMVEFQEDDNPLTTGNGKFNSEVDDYPITLASPPYNRQFFETQLEAMKYYYRAVSYEAFQLEYEVYPKTMQAYTLPQELGYYSPLESDIFIERIEQYFQDIWNTVAASDDRPEFFGDFGHFMIIHAGSSWQHDRYNDSPQDMPSFFINIADGKEVIVDNGLTKIKTSANVPERIWQDVDVIPREDSSGVRFKTGYGVVNAVFAHEFGHSLGFVDLYNTATGRPGVGVFDIMDSGGMERIIADIDDEGVLYVVEGLFPALPSVWTRIIAFEQNFLERGLLKDLSAAPPGIELQILASSTRQEIGEEFIPYFYRIWLSETEYILIENRGLDPDGDGGTSMQSALNRRVALHPSPIYTSGFTYEYDHLLPGFLDTQLDVHGGGILIWHIDNDRIFNEGQIIDGVFYSNFERNRVNLHRRGVRVIEADGIEDIGVSQAWFWTGTPYEYFFRYKPIIDNDGIFHGWSEEIHNMELSSTTDPALKTNSGRPSSWKISNISHVDRIMTFELSNTMFENTTTIGHFDDLYAVSNVVDFTGEGSINISILSGERGLRHFTPDNQLGYWRYVKEDGDLVVKPDFGVQTIIIDVEPISDWHSVSHQSKPIGDWHYGGLTEGFLLVYGNKIVILDERHRMEFEFESNITQPPLSFIINGETFLGLVFENSSAVYKIAGFTAPLEQRLHFNEIVKFIPLENTLYVLSGNMIYNMCPCSAEHTDDITPPIVLPDIFTLPFEPVVYNHNGRKVIYLMSNNLKIYTVIGDEVKQIFDLLRFTSEYPSQFALGYLENNASSFLLFYTETHVFVISEDGSFLPGFPQKLYDTTLKPWITPFIFDIDDEIFFMLHDNHQGLLGMGLNGKILPEKSQYWNRGDIDPQFFFDVVRNALFLLYSDKDGNVFSAAMETRPDSRILWNGFRNGAAGMIIRTGAIIPNPITDNIEVYVYPNPVRQDVVNVRINNTEAPATVRVFNIAGQLVLQQRLDEPVETFRDFRFYTDRLSSGTYFVNVEVEGRNYRDRFAVIK